MAILDFKDGICKDTLMAGYNTYLGNGQGCGTIWYRDVPTAQKALNHNNDVAKKGEDFNLCKTCRCLYSPHDPNYKKYADFACKKEKEKYAKSFESKEQEGE